ncbi:class I SAM-dependent methyltransferase [Tenacibaculum sp. S7007]|uniref:Class I SAM-dependent methyltransferase n=1 Tax=Tenacibaculum pelagium TaxID=2759527 RepID=A0A839ALK3_9FLAO|nr:class I SAM-dependent methyltransferase [Tenacibaculum pelagium]MBA6155049.1 class I SAM-dependent methyltransferase [Tenacibaculum pelagium]
MVEKVKKPWPTKKAMEQVYEMNLWGGNTSEFYSGEGSHKANIIEPYLAVIRSFLKSFKEPLTVCDLGCGDFNVGKELVQYSKKYIAVDIVRNLIEYNKSVFQKDNLEFHCLDIAKDDLPMGDCAIIRQVLQHLSNKEVKNVVEKLSVFKYIILTEHVPEGEFIPNKDIISGQGIRLKKQSGIDLLVSPFNLKIKKKRQLLRIPLKNKKGVIITTLYKMF